jgi:drug/metabolite transporter (DMT)-like permease
MKTLKKSIVAGVFSVSISAMLWGLDGVLLTPRLHHLNVGFVVFVLHLIPFLLMHLFLFDAYKRIFSFSGTALFYLFLTSLAGGAMGTLFIVKALFLVNFEKLSVVVLLQKLQPVFAIALAFVLLKERPGKYFIFWGTIAIICGYFLSFGFHWPDLHSGRNTIYAAFFAFLAAFSFAGSTVFSKRVLLEHDFKTLTFGRYGLTTIIMLLYVLIDGHISDFQHVKISEWLIILIIGISTGSGAIFLYYYGLKKIRAIIATIAELFFPVSVIVFDYVFNKQNLNTTQWISLIIMLIAILNLNYVHVKKRTHSKEIL